MKWIWGTFLPVLITIKGENDENDSDDDHDDNRPHRWTDWQTVR